MMIQPYYKTYSSVGRIIIFVLKAKKSACSGFSPPIPSKVALIHTFIAI